MIGRQCGLPNKVANAPIRDRLNVDIDDQLAFIEVGKNIAVKKAETIIKVLD